MISLPYAETVAEIPVYKASLDMVHTTSEYTVLTAKLCVTDQDNRKSELTVEVSLESPRGTLYIYLNVTLYCI